MSTLTSLASASAAASTSALDAAGTTSSALAASASLSSVLASASAALASEAALASGKKSTPAAFTYVGIALAVASGLFIGSSFVFKKKGLLQSQAKFGQRAGEGHAYLKSWLWWTGMVLMILGEVLNLVALSISSALLVTPLGALSVVICAILSSIFLKEKLTLFGKVGAFLCIVGSTGIALNAPVSHAAGDIEDFMHLFIAPGFLVWMSLCIIASLVLAFFVAPRWGKKQVMVHIGICSLTGGLSVSCISGIGSAVILSIRGDMQLKHWFFYFLLVFVVVTLLVEINYLNKALELFNTAMVTPTYYVVFTFCTLVSSIILFQGLDTTATGIITIVLCFLTICSGITLLQLSKIDPATLTNADGSPLDRETTLLIRVSRSHLAHQKGLDATAEDPGPDAVRGGLGVLGSMVRARSRRRLHSSSDAYAMSESGMLNTSSSRDLQRFELSDSPMRRPGDAALTLPNLPFKRNTAISFTEESKQPHGHHAGEAAWRTEGGHGAQAGMAAIREDSGDTRDSNNATPSIRPVNALRTMWDNAQPRDSYDHTPAALDKESHDGSPEEEHSHKFFPQPRRNEPNFEEESQLLRPRSATVDSDDEEERQKGRAVRRR